MVNAKQHSEAELLIFENYSHPSSTLSSKNKKKNSKKICKKRSMSMKMNMKTKNRSHGSDVNIVHPDMGIIIVNIRGLSIC